MPSTGGNTALILIVEDSMDDFVIMNRAFQKSGLTNPVVHVQKGEHALDYLYGMGHYSNQPHSSPSLIVLDLNLPGIDGIEVLKRVKGDVQFQRIPVVVFTTSMHSQDVETCYEQGANSYIRKPVNLQGFVEAVADIKHYWLEFSVLPQ